MRERWSNLHERYAELCRCAAAATDMPTQYLDNRNGLLGAQQLVTGQGDDACHADMLPSIELRATMLESRYLSLTTVS